KREGQRDAARNSGLPRKPNSKAKSGRARKSRAFAGLRMFAVKRRRIGRRDGEIRAFDPFRATRDAPRRRPLDGSERSARKIAPTAAVEAAVLRILIILIIL